MTLKDSDIGVDPIIRDEPKINEARLVPRIYSGPWHGKLSEELAQMGERARGTAAREARTNVQTRERA